MGPSQPLAPSDLACGTQAPRPIHCLRSEWQRPEVGLFCTRHAALQACKPAPSPCRSPQLALPGLARGWSVAQATGRGTGPSSNSRSTPNLEVIQSSISSKTSNCPNLPFIPPASRVTRLAACCVLRAASLRHYTGISSTPYPTAPWTGFDAHPPSTLRFSSATTRRRHSSRARPNFKLSALLQPPTTPSLETPIIAAPYHRTIESSHHSHQLLPCVFASSREREGQGICLTGPFRPSK